MERNSEMDVDIRVQKSMTEALYNPLIIEKICAFSPEGADLLSLRLVNRLFHIVATKRLKDVHQKHIDLTEESCSENFLARMRTRLYPDNINSFPFTSFKLSLRNSVESIERFATEAGPHIRRFKFHQAYPEYPWNAYQLEEKLVALLSHTPNLAEIDILTGPPIWLPNHALVTIPETFPYLRVINLEHKRRESQTPADSTSLLTLLSTRATGLDHIARVRIDSVAEGSEAMTSLRALSLHHSRQRPMIREFRITVRPSTLSILQELRTFNLRIDTVQILVLQNLVQAYSGFLTSLSSNLNRLYLNMYVGRTNNTVTFPIPPLAKLTELCLFLIPFDLDESPAIINVPLTPNQFPALRKIILRPLGFRDTAVCFEGSPQPSVQELDIESPSSPLESSPWHIILPNLRSLYFLVQPWSPYDSTSVGYILKNLSHITHLQLDFKPSRAQEFEIDYWDILTGAAPRPVSSDDPAEQEQPVDGVYQIPSLGNLRALKTLTCRPGRQSHLDAILYMTRTGRLGPLKKITLLAVVQDLRLQVDEKELLRDFLAQVHTNVCVWDYLL